MERKKEEAATKIKEAYRLWKAKNKKKKKKKKWSMCRRVHVFIQLTYGINKSISCEIKVWMNGNEKIITQNHSF